MPRSKKRFKVPERFPNNYENEILAAIRRHVLDDAVLTRKEVATLAELTPESLSNWVKRGKLTITSNSGHIQYSVVDAIVACLIAKLSNRAFSASPVVDNPTLRPTIYAYCHREFNREIVAPIYLLLAPDDAQQWQTFEVEFNRKAANLKEKIDQDVAVLVNLQPIIRSIFDFTVPKLTDLGTRQLGVEIDSSGAGE